MNLSLFLYMTEYVNLPLGDTLEIDYSVILGDESDITNTWDITIKENYSNELNDDSLKDILDILETSTLKWTPSEQKYIGEHTFKISDNEDLIVNVYDIPTSGVSNWTFNDVDTVNSTAIDIWGSNDAEIHNIVTGSEGANKTYNTGESYSFNGSDSRVVNNNIDIPSDEITISCWQYAESISSNKCTFQIPGSDYSNELALFYQGGKWRILHSNNRYETGEYINNEWVHIVITADSSGFNFYINSTETYSVSNSSQLDFPNNDINIGTDVDASETDYGNYFNGFIADFRIYNKILSNNEISNLYKTGYIHSV